MLVLPEMALTGYIFKDNAAVQHLLEDPYSKEEKASPSLQLAKQLAIRLQCYVVIGCPVKLSSAHEEVLKDVLHHDARPADLVNGPTEVPAKDSDGCFNAALLVDAQGQLVHVFRKHFSYKDDKTWACEGPGFQCVTLPRFGKVCIAICMDLNPYNFGAPFESFELARYCQQESVDMLIMPMAWLMSSDELQVSAQDTLSEAADANTINYWATRLSPYLDEDDTTADFFFVGCNRTGTEQESKFAGSSCALHFTSKRDANDSPVALLGAMSRQEGVRIFNLIPSDVERIA